MNDNKPFFKMIDELCIEKGIKQEKISFGWIRKLTKNNESHSIIRYEFDLNSAVSYEIAKDKYATYAMLKNNNIPINKLLSSFNVTARAISCRPINIRDSAKLILKNGKLIPGIRSNIKHVIFTTKTE